MDNQPKLLNTSETSNFVGIATDTLARWRMERKHLPFVKLGSKVYYRDSDLIDFINNNRIEAVAD